MINTCWYTCTFNILGRCAKGLSWNHGKEETLFMSAISSYSVTYLDIFAGLIGLICRFFCVIASLFIASRIKRENLSAIERRSQRFWCNDWLERQVLDLINTLISMDDNSTRYILLPNAIICKLEVLHDPVPSFVSRSLPYCQVVGL